MMQRILESGAVRWLRLIGANVLAVALISGCGPGQREIGAAMQDALVEPAFAADATWADEVREFYANRELQPAWTNGRGLNGRGRRVAALLDSAEHDGLDPAQYGTGEIARLREAIDNTEDDSVLVAMIATLDAQISAGYRRYLGDLDAGAIGASDFMDRPHRETTSLVAKLDAAAAGDDPSTIAKSLEPVSPQYRALKSALVRYTDIARLGGWPTVSVHADSGAAAAQLRARLIAEGDPVESELASTVAATPASFDTTLIAALRHFQKRHGLEEHGRLDDATLRELNTPVQQRVATLSLNLDRWRAMPREPLPLGVRVNIPAYEMAVLEDDQPVLEMKVVVGALAHPTPVMIDTMEYVVTSPYWNVPASILSEEIAPGVAEDDDYLRDRSMEIVARDDTSVEIEPGSIDWDELNVDSIDWLVRQRPGANNALGRVKFMFPNTLDIYLHDTPSQSGFEQTIRAISHGCVRLEKPIELARLVLGRRASIDQDIEALVATGEEKHIPLDVGIPVHIVYLTASADNGIVRFHADIYGLDQRVGEVVEP
jgi:murein L,D-transpeptidase YcbB/YkuD